MSLCSVSAALMKSGPHSDRGAGRVLSGIGAGVALACLLLARPGAARADAVPVPLAPGPARSDSVAPAPALGPAPAIEIKETSQDGGTVDEGTTLQFHFTVSNTGKGDLQITQVKPSCGCTVPHWDKTVAPGKSGTIDAEVHTAHFRGAILKHLTVISNDPQHPQIELSLTAKITPLVEINPGQVAMLSVDEKPASQVFTLARTNGQPMKILQVNATVPYVKTELTPLNGGGSYQLTVTATTDAPMGRSPVPVIVKTDVPNVSDFTLTLIVDRGIITTPPMIYWSVPPEGLKAPVSGMVTVMRQQGPFHIKNVSVDDPKLEAKLDTVRDGQEYRVTVTYSGGWEGDHTQKTLTMTTDDPKQPELKVPVMAMVQRAFVPPPTTGSRPIVLPLPAGAH